MLLTRLAVIIAALALCAGCDHSATGLDSIRVGMTKEDVRSRVGEPIRVLDDRNGPEPDGSDEPELMCWLYPVDPNWRYICFSTDGRVADISTSLNLGGVTLAALR
jgi:hypothetical protein